MPGGLSDQYVGDTPDVNNEYTAPDSAIAVIGMACKFAGADSLEQFWNVLETGSVQCRELPNDRFPDWRFERRSYPKNFKANVINDVDAFDHKFFHVTSREAMFMDPQQRIALEIAYQALESAAYFSRNASAREKDIGCYMATCMNEYHENVVCHPPSAFSLTGSIRPWIAGKVSHYFGFTGPAMMFDTACAASGTAVHQACRAIASGECGSALAGATNIFVSPDTFQDLAAGQFISPTGQSKPFDAAADGYCRGEGVAFVVLKSLSAAIRDGDSIKGVLLSTAIGQNANETSITVPHGPSQMNLYRKALRLAGLNARDISYIEAHGTGTRVGDPIEAESIRGVFGSTDHHSHGEKTYLGSLKSNIGHAEACSGLSELIKVLLMMHKGIIPRQALFNSLNPAIPALDKDNIEIPRSNVLWSSRYKTACVNNYGASGSNAVMIITQPPRIASPLQATQVTSYPISITAFSPSSLASYCSKLLEYISQTVKQELITDVAYQLSRRRNPDLFYSVTAAVSSYEELKHWLESTKTKQPHLSEEKAKPAVLFFGGQTGKPAYVPQALYDSCFVFRKHLNDCDTTSQILGVSSIFPIVFDPCLHEDVIVAHSILFSEQYAHAMTWIDCGLQPARLIGHSFGQLTALCVAGVLTLHDCLRLITERARLIQELRGTDQGSMVAIEADLDRVSNLLSNKPHVDLEIACHNGPQSFVLAGSTSSADLFESALKTSLKLSQWKRLQIQYAFHSPLTEPVIGPLQELAEQFTFHHPRFTIETCSEDNTWPQATPTLIASHTREPVYFHQAVQRISEQLGPCTWLEAGSNHGASVLRRALGDLASYHNVMFLKAGSTSLSPLAEVTADLWKLGLDVQFWPFHQSQHAQYKDLNLPPYQFDKARHWLDWKGPDETSVETQHQPAGQTSPLQLVQNTEYGVEFHVDVESEKWQTTCSDHQILGRPACPLAFLVDLVLEAIAQARSSSAPKPSVYDIRDLVINNPVPADSKAKLMLTVTGVGERELTSFTISKASAQNHIYVSGTVSAKNNGSGRGFTRFQRSTNIAHIWALSNDPEANIVRGIAVYKSLADWYQVAKHGQVIKEVSSKANEAAGHLLPLNYDAFTSLDAFIQVPLISLNSLRDRHDENVYMFTALGEFRLRPNLEFLRYKTSSWSVYNFDLDPTQAPEVMQPRTPQSEDAGRRSSSDIATPPAGLPDLTTALNQLFVQIADVEPNLLHDDTEFDDLGLDSLMRIEMLEEINKFFSIKIGIAEAATTNDMGTLRDLIASRTKDYA